MLGTKDRQTARGSIVSRQQDDEERYYRHEQGKMLMDELTDQSERLSVRMENSFTYQQDEAGKLYAEFDGQPMYLETVFREGLIEGERLAGQDPTNWGFEAERRRIESEELQDIQQLEDGEKMIVFSPLPDAVREGKTNIGGYNRDRQKMLVRLAGRDGDSTEITSFSLDGSNYQAMQAAAREIGGEIPDGLSSEQILAERFFAPAGSEFTLDDCHGLIRSAYDADMERQFGAKFYAGRHGGMSEQDALSYIKSQPELITQHMEAVQSVMAQALDKNRQNKLLETARYDFAAALDKRMKGEFFDSINDAGDMDRSAGVDHSGDCATGGAEGGSGSTDEQAKKLGYKRGNNPEMKCVGCPLPGCGKTVNAIVGSDTIGCPACKRSLNKKTGKISSFDTESGGDQQETVSDMIMRFGQEAKLQQQEREEQQKQTSAKTLGKTAASN